MGEMVGDEGGGMKMATIRSVGRLADVRSLLDHLAMGENCAIVGVSNVGKSTLLRLVHVHGRQEYSHILFVYVDCNRMLNMSEQGFYELVLRCILDEIRLDAELHEAGDQLYRAYQTVTSPASSFHVSLGFNEGITVLIEALARSMVLLLDEFDEPLQGLDGRVLLNLRALRDRYPGRLSYAVATNRPMREIRDEPAVDEFCELFAHHTHYLSPLSDSETRDLALQLAQRDHVTFDERDIEFIQQKSGGHPGLVEAVCGVLGSVTGAPVRDPTQDWIIHREVNERLRTDSVIQVECLKLWNELTLAEQEGLLALLSAQEKPPAEVLRSLENKHLVRVTTEGVQFFSQVFEDFVRRQRAVQRGARRAIRLDIESGQVWVEGKLAPPLTRLEHRLLMLLYGQLGKICDKYQVVEAVWGEEYIEEVDDARIEKLFSRLRQKIEPDPANPRYLITVRGRGYKLVDE